jgi:hypothetical protein
MHRKIFGIRVTRKEETDWNYRAMSFKFGKIYQILVGSPNQEEQDRGEGHIGEAKTAFWGGNMKESSSLVIHTNR